MRSDFSLENMYTVLYVLYCTIPSRKTQTQAFQFQLIGLLVCCQLSLGKCIYPVPVRINKIPEYTRSIYVCMVIPYTRVWINRG